MRISEISPQTLAKVSDKELLSLHLRCHQLWGLIEKRGDKPLFGAEELINAHSLIVREMLKRGFEHNLVSKIDRFEELQSYRQEVLSDLLKTYPLIETDYYVFLDNGECYTNLPEKLRPTLYMKLRRLFARAYNLSIPIHYTREPKGTPIYKIVLLARDKIEVRKMQHEDEFRERYYIKLKEAKILNSLPPNHSFDILIYDEELSDIAEEIQCSKKIPFSSDKKLERLKIFYDEPISLFLTKEKIELKRAKNLTISGFKNYDFSVEDKLNNLVDFVIVNEFVSATGSFVYGKLLPDDLDIVVKTDSFENELKILSEYIKNKTGLEAHFSISRFGANWDYIPLYDLVAKTTEEVSLSFRAKKASALEIEAKKSKKEDRIIPGRAFYPLKTDIGPIMGYRKLEVFSKESFKEVVEKFKKRKKIDYFPPMYASKKYDGNRVVIHKYGEKVLIYSDDGVDLTSRLPNTSKELLRFNIKNLVLDCELEMWDGKTKFPREMVAGWLHSNKDPDKEANVIINVFDCLYFEDDDLHNKPLKERLQFLDKVPFKQSTDSYPNLKFRFNKTPNYLIENYEEAWKIIEYLSSQPYSEGVMLKLADSTYPLNGRTSEWIKFKIYAELHVVVIDKKETKTKGVYNYLVGILAENSNVKEKVEINGLILTPIGWIYNTKEKLEIGDVITEKIHSLNLYKHKDGSISISHYEPIFYEKRERDYRQVDSVSSAIKIGKDAGILTEKIEEVENQEDILIVPPEENTYRFVMQHHFRGKSVHIDFRVEKTGYLSGWTIADAIPDAIDEPVNSLSDAKKLLKENKAFKIDFEKGEFKKRKTKSGVIRKTSLYATTKAPEPLEWLDVEGVTHNVGATKNYPGVFHIIDKGEIEYGVHKPYFIEYFLNGKIFKGRLVFRLLGKRELVRNQEILPPSEEQENPSPLIWLCIQPEDQLPYVLSKRAETDGYTPPFGYSFLPKVIKEKIPEKYRYWLIRDDKERSKILSELRKDKKLIKELLSHYEKYIGKVENMVDSEFLLQRVYWKGRKVIRVGPTTEVFYLVIKPNMVFSTIYDLRKTVTDITFYEDTMKKTLLEEYDVATKIEPGHEINPTKNTPCWIKTIDKGKCKILIDSDEMKRITFEGNILNGTFHLIREKDSPFFVFTPANVPVTSFLKLNEEKRFVLGPALIPNALDANGNIFPTEVVKLASYSFIREYIDEEKEANLLKNASVLEVGVQRFDNGKIPKNSVFLTLLFEDEIPSVVKNDAFYLEGNVCSFILDVFDTEEEAENVAWNLLKSLSKDNASELFDVHHKYPVPKDKVILVESYLKKEDTEEFGLPINTWMLGFLVLDDNLWYKIKNGEITSLSIYGYGTASKLKGVKDEIPSL